MWAITILAVALAVPGEAELKASPPMRNEKDEICYPTGDAFFRDRALVLLKHGVAGTI